MFVDNEELHRNYRGYNPAFVRRVRERRRERERAEALAADRARRAQEEAARKAELDRVRQYTAVEEARQAQIAKARELGKESFQTAKMIAAQVGARHGFTFNELVGPSRAIPLVKARHEAMAEVRERKPNMSLPQIGRLFNRDHTSVIHALKRVAKDRAAVRAAA